MAVIAGVDGCKSGWICITKDLQTDCIDSAVYPNAQLLYYHLSKSLVIAVDIPIGLTTRESRLCDIDARKILGNRKSSVFPAPIRPVIVIKATCYKEANAINRDITDKGISQQSFAICKKICEFDTLLSNTPYLQQQIKEVHPEVCFRAWNNNQPMKYNKKTTQGRNERQELIKDYFGQESLNSIRSKYLKKEVADDDIHDAFAALWTAERILNNKANRIPENPPIDSMGLAMEIWS